MNHVYSSPVYAAAFSDIAQVVEIKSLGIWALVRNIAGTPFRDAIGLYPMCAPSRPSSLEQLHQELNDLDLVSLVFVTDPFVEDICWFANTFDFVRQYKKHYTIEGSLESFELSRHHRRAVRTAQRSCEIRRIDLLEHLDEWMELFEFLSRKHDLQGVHRFSRSYFKTISSMSEFTAFGAFIDKNLVSACLTATNGEWVQLHLMATNEKGYQHSASYALLDFSIREFKTFQGINIGGEADVRKPGADLDFFKKGFSNRTRLNWLCGKVIDHKRYADLCMSSGVDRQSTTYFPAYRTPKQAIE